MITKQEHLVLRVLRWPLRVHSDQRGSISIVSVFAMLVLVMLLGMVLNSGLQVDQKVKMQNAADAATYSGAVAISRSMNTLAFTNHLLCDVFALTAFMREARDQSAESLTPDILANWERIGPALEGSEFDKFENLGIAIQEKLPYETDLVVTFNDWAGAAAELMLPVFEQILAEQRIPEFQRALVRTTPQLAQAAAAEIASRHGAAWPVRADLYGVLYRTDGVAMDRVSDEESRFLPVVDPVIDQVPDQAAHREIARRQRFELSHRYLRQWNNESLPIFDSYAKMSRFSSLWRIFTGGHLQKLLEEDYPSVNLPCQALATPTKQICLNGYLERHHMVVGVVYRQQRPGRHMPRIFRNPMEVDQQAYAQAMVFVPRRRLVKHWIRPGGGGGGGGSTGTGVPGQGINIGGPPIPPTPPPPPPPADEEQEAYSIVIRQNVHYYPEPWTLVNQNWTAQLTPATCRNIPRILEQTPYCQDLPVFEVPDLQGISYEDFLWVSNH